MTIDNSPTCHYYGKSSSSSLITTTTKISPSLITILLLICITLLSTTIINAGITTRNMISYSTNGSEYKTELIFYLPATEIYNNNDITLFNIEWCYCGDLNIIQTDGVIIHDPIYNPTLNTITASVTTSTTCGTTEQSKTMYCAYIVPFPVPFVVHETRIGSSTTSSTSVAGYAGSYGHYYRYTADNLGLEIYFQNLHFMIDERLSNMVRFIITPTFSSTLPDFTAIWLLHSDGTIIKTGHGCTSPSRPITSASRYITCSQPFPQFVTTMIVRVDTHHYYSNIGDMSYSTSFDIRNPETNYTPFGYTSPTLAFLGEPDKPFYMNSFEQSITNKIPLPSIMYNDNNINNIEYIANYGLKGNPRFWFNRYNSNYNPQYHFVIPQCISSDDSTTFTYDGTNRSWLSPEPTIQAKSPTTTTNGTFTCDIIFTPFFPNNINLYSIHDENSNPLMFNTNPDDLLPWPIYPIGENKLLKPLPFRLISLPSITNLLSNPIDKYFKIETNIQHYGISIMKNNGNHQEDNNNDNNNQIYNVISNRLTIAINGGFKPESRLTIKLSIPKLSILSSSTTSSTIIETSSTSISTSLSTAVKLRLENNNDEYTRDIISTLLLINKTIDITTNNNYDIVQYEFDISDYAHPEFILTIELPIYRINNTDPISDIYFAQINEENGQIINTFSLLSQSFPIELIYYNRGTSSNGYYSGLPRPIIYSQQLEYILPTSFELLPNIQCHIQFNASSTSSSSSTSTMKYAQITMSLNAITIKPSTEQLLTYHQHSLWKTLSITPTITKIYPNSLIIIDYSQSTSTVEYISNSFQFINYPKLTTENDWSNIIHNDTLKTLSLLYIGTTTIIINENDNDYNINEWFTFQLSYTKVNDIISIQHFISMDTAKTTTSIQSFIGTTISESKCYNYCHNDNTNLCNEDATGDESPCICNQGYIDDKCEILSKCHNYDCNDDTTKDCNEDAIDGQSPCICNDGYIGNKCEIVSKCHNYCLRDNTKDCNEDAVDNQSPCICNDLYIGDKCESLISKCDGYCHNDNTEDCNEDAIDGESPCRCNDGYIGDTCEILSKCHNYCTNGNYESCDENIEISNDPSTTTTITTPCRCKTGWVGLKCDIEDKKRNNNPNNTLLLSLHIFIFVIIFILQLI